MKDDTRWVQMEKVKKNNGGRMKEKFKHSERKKIEEEEEEEPKQTNKQTKENKGKQRN